MRHFVAAGSAPDAPQVHHNDFTFIVSKLCLGAVEQLKARLGETGGDRREQRGFAAGFFGSVNSRFGGVAARGALRPVTRGQP